MSREAHTVKDFGRPEYLDGAMMRFALSDEQGRRTAYVATKADATLYAAAPALLAGRAALLEALPDLSSVIAWLDNGCDPKHAADELRIYQQRIEAARHSATGEG